MIVRRATEKDSERIEKAWKEIFKEDDFGHSDFYFKYAYKPQQSYLLVNEKDELISACQVHTKTLMLASKPLRVSFIVGVFTLPEHRYKGYMKQLLTKVLDVCEHQDHFTLIQAYDPTLYLKYGFEPIYDRQIFTLDAQHVPVLSPSGVSYAIEAEAMLKLYKNFSSHFDGYIRRNLEDFKKLSAEISAQGGKIIGYTNNGLLESYACVLFEGKEVVLDELVYINANALLKLLNSITSMNKKIVLKVSPQENLKKILPKAVVEKETYTYVKINHIKLFNELYKVNVHSAQEAFLLAQKPLWIRENQ